MNFQIGGEPWYPPFYKEPKPLPDLEAGLPIPQKRQNFLLIDAGSACLCIAITFVAWRISKLTLFRFLFVASMVFLPVTLLRRVFELNSFVQCCERISLVLIHKIPYLKILIVVVGTLSLRYIPVAGYCLGVSLGILQGLTNETRLLQKAMRT